jgi:PTH2 family peptidyl-tRNA hydrolase
MQYEIKQVILVRTDLNMRKGKIAAQVAHASMKVFFDRRVFYLRNIHLEDYLDQDRLDKEQEFSEDIEDLLLIPLTDYMAAWVEGSFAKIVLGVESEAHLLEALRLAQEAGLPCALITDAGNTEFHGVPTNTCVAIGPAKVADIDVITGPQGAIPTRLI